MAKEDESTTAEVTVKPAKAEITFFDREQFVRSFPEDYRRIKNDVEAALRAGHVSALPMTSQMFNIAAQPQEKALAAALKNLGFGDESDTLSRYVAYEAADGKTYGFKGYEMQGVLTIDRVAIIDKGETVTQSSLAAGVFSAQFKRMEPVEIDLSKVEKRTTGETYNSAVLTDKQSEALRKALENFLSPQKDPPGELKKMPKNTRVRNVAQAAGIDPADVLFPSGGQFVSGYTSAAAHLPAHAPKGRGV